MSCGQSAEIRLPLICKPWSIWILTSLCKFSKLSWRDADLSSTADSCSSPNWDRPWGKAKVEWDPTSTYSLSLWFQKKEEGLSDSCRLPWLVSWEAWKKEMDKPMSRTWSLRSSSSRDSSLRLRTQLTFWISWEVASVKNIKWKSTSLKISSTSQTSKNTFKMFRPFSKKSLLLRKESLPTANNTWGISEQELTSKYLI